MKKLGIASLFLLTFLNVTYAEGALVFTDWTSINTDSESANGFLGSITVTFSGGDIDAGTTDGTSALFNEESYFNPSLQNSDEVGFRGANINNSAYNYTVTFSNTVVNPVMHLGSLASTLLFPGISLTKRSGEAVFTVTGNMVSGVLDDTPSGHDANGTIQLNGNFLSFSFTARALGDFEDGIHMQLGGAPIPIPTTILLVGSGLIGIAGFRRKN